MKKNRIIIAILLMALSGGISVFVFLNRVKSSDKKGQIAGLRSGQDEKDVKYWTCSMHPQVRSDSAGKCPICGMELIPIYKEDAGKIVLEKSVADKIGIRSEPVQYRHLIKEVRLPGKVSHDKELYVLQQEYLSILASYRRLSQTASEDIISRERSLLEATELRLKLLGFKDEQIKEFSGMSSPDESLIYPAKGRAWIHADVYEQDLNLVRSGQKVKAAIKGYEGGEFSGEIKAIEEVLSPQTRSAKARIEVPDQDNKLKHELYADLTAEIDLGRRLGVPVNSVIDTGVRKVVYVDLGGGRYQMRQVKTGVIAGAYTEAVEGLKEGDKVVTDGNFFLDSQSTLSGGQSLLYGAAEEVEAGAAPPQHKH